MLRPSEVSLEKLFVNHIGIRIDKIKKDFSELIFL